MSLNRILSSKLTHVLLKFPIRPNHVTTLALVAGAVAGWYMARGSHVGLLWGSLWLHLSFILDNCDGEIARKKSMNTTLGKWYDLTADLVVDWCLWMGLGYGVTRLDGSPIWLWIGVTACIGSLLNQIMVVIERKKNICTSIHSDSSIKDERSQTFHLRVLDFLSHNGDIIFFVWIMALFGNASVFLVGGCLYIYLLWIGRFASHRKSVVL